MSSFDASRWADAYVATAGKQPETGLGVLEEIAAAVKSLHLSSGAFAGETAAARLEAATKSLSGLSSSEETARRLVVLMTRAGRITEVGEVAVAVRALLRERAGIVQVRAETAFPLDAKTSGALSAALKKRLGAAEIELDVKVDPALLGGVRIGIGWERIDGSLRGRLEAFASATGAAKRGGGKW